MTWTRTGVAFDSLESGTMRAVSVENEEVLLVRLVDGVYATQARCSHEGGDLTDGTLSAGRVECPMHGAVFNVRDGQVLTDPDGVTPPQGGASPLEHFPTRVSQGEIEIDLP